MSVHRRSRTGVIVDILNEALNNASKTRIMYRCNLNFASLNRYLQELIDTGLVECMDADSEGIALYKTTDKGRELLKVLQKASEFLSI